MALRANLFCGFVWQLDGYLNAIGNVGGVYWFMTPSVVLLHFLFFLIFFVLSLYSIVLLYLRVRLRLCVGTDTVHTRRLAGSIPANRLV